MTQSVSTASYVLITLGSFTIRVYVMIFPQAVYYATRVYVAVSSTGALPAALHTLNSTKVRS